MMDCVSLEHYYKYDDYSHGFSIISILPLNLMVLAPPFPLK
jgi:hypothetical protein